jgi:hypothetical protein
MPGTLNISNLSLASITKGWTKKLKKLKKIKNQQSFQTIALPASNLQPPPSGSNQRNWIKNKLKKKKKTKEPGRPWLPAGWVGPEYLKKPKK